MPIDIVKQVREERRRGTATVEDFLGRTRARKAERRIAQTVGEAYSAGIIFDAVVTPAPLTDRSRDRSIVRHQKRIRASSNRQDTGL